MAAITAATAGLISAGVAAAGTAASVGMNLSAAAKQAKAQSAAEQAASEAAKKAEQEYQKQFLGGVQVPTEAYNQALRQGTAQQMQSLQALQEADARTLAAGVGKVQAQATEAQAATTNQMASDMYSLQLAQAKEQGLNRDAIARMNEQRAIGAGAAAADAEVARMKAYAGIGPAITSLGAMGLQSASLYGKTGDTTTPFTDQAMRPFNPAGQLPVTLSGFSNNTPSNYNPTQVPGLTSPSVLTGSGFDLNKFNQQQLQQAQYNTYIDAFGQQQQYKAY